MKKPTQAMKLALAVGFVASQMAIAADLKAPFSLPSARVLPKGVRNLSYKDVIAGANERYANNGQPVALANAMNQPISFQRVIDSKKEAWEKAAIEQAMLDLGKTPDDSFGSTTGDVNVSATAHVPVLAWGLTNKFTFAVAVPIIQSTVNVDTGVVQQNPQLHAQMVAALNSKGVSTKVAELNDKMANAIPEKLNEYGYHTIQNENKTALGDIKLVGKYNFVQQAEHLVTANLEVTLPTGKDVDVNEVVDVASGDEQTDVGVGMNYDYNLSETLTLSTGASYTVQLADRAARRIPEFSYSRLSPDIDGKSERDLGDIAAAQFGTAWNFKGMNLGAGYTYQYKGADRFNGSAYSSERYDWLEIDTRQNMHAVQLVAGYDTIYLFKKKSFPAPLKVLFTHTRVVDGKNVVKDPLYALDFNLFF